MNAPGLGGIVGLEGAGIPPVAMLASMPFDSSLPLVGSCGFLAGVALLLWSQSGTRGYLIAIVAAAAIGVTAFLADWAVVTDREQVEGLFPRLARAAEAGDTATILAAFDPAMIPPRAEAERALREFRPESVRVTQLDVTLSGPESDRRARAGMLIHARGDARGSGGMAGPLTTLIDLDVDLRKAEGRFLITGFDADLGRPRDRH